jgi:hypothetical protein
VLSNGAAARGARRGGAWPLAARRAFPKLALTERAQPTGAEERRIPRVAYLEVAQTPPGACTKNCRGGLATIDTNGLHPVWLTAS